MFKTFIRKISHNFISNNIQNAISPVSYNNMTQLATQIILLKLGYKISVITVILLFL